MSRAKKRRRCPLPRSKLKKLSAYELKRRHARGGRNRAERLSAETRQEIARLGYQAMLRRRHLRILEAALFGVVE